ncbi:MAG: CBS domain-containing protein [Bacteroidales bacterium]
MIAKQLISTTVPVLQTTNTGAEALYQMDESRFYILPVFEDGRFLGLISEVDIYNMSDPDLPVSESTVALKKYFISEYQHIFDVIKMMSSYKLSLLPVLDENDAYLGAISAVDVVKMLGERSAINNPGGIIVLELNQNDYVLSQIAQIVESQDGKILSLLITSDKDSTKLEIDMKINIMELQPLIQTLNRYNYSIKATYSEDEEMFEDMRDRYNSLMNYLNI